MKEATETPKPADSLNHDLAFCVKRLVINFFGVRDEELWHPDSPGMRVPTRRSWLGRVFKPAHFATLGETISFRKSQFKY